MSAAASEPAQDVVRLREHLDFEAAFPVLLYFATGVVWLLAGSVFGLLTSLKFDLPDWLGAIPALTFGRLRPAHLNAVTYGWASLAGAGCLVWLTSRLCRVPIRRRGWLIASAVLWNIGLVYGTGAILAGYSQGVEWLEFPLPALAIIAAAFLLFAGSISATFRARQVEHLYVSLWYIMAAVVWFPHSVRGGEPAYLLGRAARRGELVVRPQRAGGLVHAHRPRAGLLLHPESHRPAHLQLLPFAARLLGLRALL